MAASGTLYGVSEDIRTKKILIACKYSGAKLTLEPDFTFGKTNKSDEFLEKFPLGKVPAFKSSKGDLIYESNAIMWFVANEQLRGKTILDQALVQQWINFADNEITPSASTWLFPIRGIMGFNKNTHDKAKEVLFAALSVLNSYLLKQTYLVGERITLADISVCCSLVELYENVLEPQLQKTYQNVTRWFNTIINQAEFKDVAGSVTLCTKMAQFDGKKYAEFMGNQKKEQKETKDKPKAKKQEKAPAAKETPAPAAAAPAPKPKDPLDGLPTGKFDMDDWKRFYSNNDEDKYMPYFWDKYDKDTYSLWYCEYKYPQDLSKIFMTCNLVGGMFQRLDKLNKYAFASMLICGEDGNNNISGVWLWKGHELVFPLSENWTVDYESYDWKKLDPTSEDDKKIVSNYWKWEGTDNKGRSINQGKVFK